MSRVALAGEKVTPADDALATYDTPSTNPVCTKRPSLSVPTAPGARCRNLLDGLPGSANETTTLAAGRPFTVTTPLAWNVPIARLRKCRAECTTSSKILRRTG